MSTSSSSNHGTASPESGATSSLPLFLALVAGGGTAFGAVILLLLIPSPPPVNALSAANASLFGRLQAASAGVMVALSLGLFTEAVPETGLATGCLYAVVGFALMLLVEHGLAFTNSPNSQHKHHHHGMFDANNALIRNYPDPESGTVSIQLPLLSSDPASGIPIAHAPPSFPPTSVDASSPTSLPPSTFEYFLMNMFGAGPLASGSHTRGASYANTLSLVRSSFVTYMGLAIHNLPEGISVALTTASNLRLGVSLCLAILLHNVLEGMIVALPLWYTSRSRTRVLLLTLLNGLMEPLGVIIAWSLGGAEVIAKPGRINKMLCAVSGIMGAIAAGELLPSAVEWIEKGGVVVMGARDGVGKSSRGKGEVYVRVAAWTIVGVVGGWAVMASADMVLARFNL